MIQRGLAADAGQQFLHPKGLHDIILRPRIQCRNRSRLIGAHRQHQDQHLPPAANSRSPNLGQHRKPVGIGRARVKDNNPGA